MVIDCVIIKERGIVFSTATGTVTDALAMQHRDRISEDPAFQSSFWQLLDMTTVDYFKMTSTGIRVLAERNPFSEGSRRAIVVDSELSCGMVRMYQLLTDQHAHDRTVFKDLKEARAWLGLPNEVA